MLPGVVLTATASFPGRMTVDVPNFLPSLRRGAGRRPADGGCLVQVASMLSDGRSWTDHPDCVHPVLREVAVRINDRMPDGDRDRLYPFAVDLVGTASPDPIWPRG